MNILRIRFSAADPGLRLDVLLRKARVGLLPPRVHLTARASPRCAQRFGNSLLDILPLHVARKKIPTCTADGGTVTPQAS
eukprot:2237844-Pleurochrysis_carterae.AAC.2